MSAPKLEPNLALPLHERNAEFRWKPITGPFRRLTDEQAQSYNEAGYFLLSGALDTATVEAVTKAIDPLEQATEAALRKQAGGRHFIARAGEITFTPHLVTRSEFLRGFVSGPLFQDLVHDLVGPDVRLYWDQAVYKKPGTDDPFPWHQDNGYAFIEPQQYLTCWIALSDTDETSGCPCVVPGLHLRGTLHHQLTDLGYECLPESPKSAVPVPARAGDIVVFSSLTPHTTGAHRGTHTRKAYIVQFAPDGAKVFRPDGKGGVTCTTADAAERQFPILIHGEAPSD